jgi:hypothetical protein
MIVSTYRCFLVGFNALSLPVKDLTDFFDTREEIVNWYGILPGQIFIVSSLDARMLNHLIGDRYPKEFFVVAQLDSASTDGWLPEDAWNFINQPQPSAARSLARNLLNISSR